MGIDVLRLDDACCYERGHDRVILCDLRESPGFAIKVKPTIAHMRYVGGVIHDQGYRHRRAHIVSLPLASSAASRGSQTHIWPGTAQRADSLLAHAPVLPYRLPL